MTEPADEAAGFASRFLDANQPGETRTGEQTTDRRRLIDDGQLVRAACGSVVFLGIAATLPWAEQFGFTVLAPDIARRFHDTDAAFALVYGSFAIAYGVTVRLAASLADRGRRRPYIAAAGLVVWSVALLVAGLAMSDLRLFIARVLLGVAWGTGLAVVPAVVADRVPIGARARASSLIGIVQAAGLAIGAVVAAILAGAVGGADAWRWTFLGPAVLGLVAACLLLRVPDERRGAREAAAVLGNDDETLSPLSQADARTRLRRVRSYQSLMIGIVTATYCLLVVPLFANFVFAGHFRMGVVGRGFATAAFMVPAIALGTLVGRRTEAAYRDRPANTLTIIGALLGVSGPLAGLGLNLGHLYFVIPAMALGISAAQLALAACWAPITTIAPPSARSRGVALTAMHLAGVGVLTGAVLTGLLADAVGRRHAIALIVVPATMLAGALVAYAGRYFSSDIALVVEDITDDHEHNTRQAAGPVPVLELRGIDFAYGKAPVLFDIDLEVWTGETLALLGTNGAGKSTLLKVVSGLNAPTRGSVRLDGRNITYTSTEQRVRLGLVELMGGDAIFPSLTVAENLRMGGYLYDGADLQTRIDRACDVLPVVRERLDQPAGSLSGGEQQMVALAMALLHEPNVLIIDELSIGLAPAVVQVILDVVRRLKADGLTMILVEQSLNIALEVADRAVFMEKGEIRFEGAARDLLEHGDLLRAVFLPPAVR